MVGQAPTRSPISWLQEMVEDAQEADFGEAQRWVVLIAMGIEWP